MDCLNILLCTYMTFNMTYLTVCIQVMPLALFVIVCFDVARLPLVLVVRPLFGGTRCLILCIYVLIQAVIVYRCVLYCSL